MVAAILGEMHVVVVPSGDEKVAWGEIVEEKLCTRGLAVAVGVEADQWICSLVVEQVSALQRVSAAAAVLQIATRSPVFSQHLAPYKIQLTGVAFPVMTAAVAVVAVVILRPSSFAHNSCNACPCLDARISRATHLPGPIGKSHGSSC